MLKVQVQIAQQRSPSVDRVIARCVQPKCVCPRRDLWYVRLCPNRVKHRHRLNRYRHSSCRHRHRSRLRPNDGVWALQWLTIKRQQLLAIKVNKKTLTKLNKKSSRVSLNVQPTTLHTFVWGALFDGCRYDGVIGVKRWSSFRGAKIYENCQRKVFNLKIGQLKCFQCSWFYSTT